MAQALNDLAVARVSVWLDDLSRPRIQTGSLARMVEEGEIVGIPLIQRSSPRPSVWGRATRISCAIWPLRGTAMSCQLER